MIQVNAETGLALVGFIFGSTGLWTLIKYLIERKTYKKQNIVNELQQLKETFSQTATLQNDMLIAMGHDRIVWLGLQYLKRGYISSEEYRSLRDIADAYKAMGGNGEAKRVMDEVDKLPIK